MNLAKAVVEACDSKLHKTEFKFTYPLEWSIEDKIRAVAKNIYGADDIELSETARGNISQFTEQGFDKMPICMAKTQYSLSHDPSKKVRITSKIVLKSPSGCSNELHSANTRDKSFSRRRISISLGWLNHDHSRTSDATKFL